MVESLAPSRSVGFSGFWIDQNLSTGQTSLGFPSWVSDVGSWMPQSFALLKLFALLELSQATQISQEYEIGFFQKVVTQSSVQVILQFQA